MKLLLDPANAEYTQEDYEKALYKSIEEEADRWVLLHAACTVSERSTLDKTQSESSPSLTTTAVLLVGKEETCCSVYDPQLRPYLPKLNHDDDEAVDVERRKRLRLQRE